MTYEEINLMPPLKMGSATCRWSRRTSGNSNEHGPKKSFKNSHKGGIKNGELISKIWKGRNNEAKMKVF
jgi:hypothetical protein